MVRLMLMVHQALAIVRNIHQVFRFNQAVVHQMMEAMEVTQEEIQEEMMAILPKTLIRIFAVNHIANHPMTRTRVEMVEEDVPDTRLLLRSTSGLSHYPS